MQILQNELHNHEQLDETNNTAWYQGSAVSSFT
jgi:hypothetical protein